MVISVEKSLAVGLGGNLASNVRMALRGRSEPRVDTIIAGLGGRPSWPLRSRAFFWTPWRASMADVTFLDLNWDMVRRELARTRQQRRSGPTAENILRETFAGKRPGMKGETVQRVKFYQTGTWTVGNRLLDGSLRTVQASSSRSNAITCGHRACQGCGEALGARFALDAALRATNGRLIAVNATGCLEVFTTPYPETSWQLPWLHSLFGNAAAVASGRCRGTSRPRAVRTSGLSLRVVMVGQQTSAWDVSRECSSVTKMCFTSATTTRRI